MGRLSCLVWSPLVFRYGLELLYLFLRLSGLASTLPSPCVCGRGSSAPANQLNWRSAHHNWETCLVVKRQEVVSGLAEATHRSDTSNALMGAVPVVMMVPARQHRRARGRMMVRDA